MKKGIIFIIFLLIAFALYFPARYSGLTWDFVGWTLIYKNRGLGGLWHLFDDRGLHPFYQLAFFGLYKLFGFHPRGWFFVFLLLHVINSFLSFAFFSRLFKSCRINNYKGVAFFGGLFFLISPYQTEPVVWKATIHYLVTTGCMLSALILSLEYAQKGEWKYLIAVHLLFVIGLFSLEIAISLPFLLLLLIILPKENIFGKTSTRDFFVRVILPQMLMIPAFFFLSKLFLGRWVAHYGSAHLNFSDTLVVGNFNRYLFKYLILGQFWKFPVRSWVYEHFALPMVARAFLVLYILTALLLWYYISNASARRSRVILALSGMCVVGMMTTVNLFLAIL